MKRTFFVLLLLGAITVHSQNIFTFDPVTKAKIYDDVENLQTKVIDSLYDHYVGPIVFFETRIEALMEHHRIKKFLRTNVFQAYGEAFNKKNQRYDHDCPYHRDKKRTFSQEENTWRFDMYMYYESLKMRDWMIGQYMEGKEPDYKFAYIFDHSKPLFSN